MIPTRVLGAGMVSETLAQYSAMMVMEATYDAEVVGRSYDYNMNEYSRGRSVYANREAALLDVEQQGYVYSFKGGVAMYLADLFERITHWDVGTDSARTDSVSGGAYRVTLYLDAASPTRTIRAPQLPGWDKYLSRRTVVWLIPILLTVHNAEEAVAFARMRGHVASLLPTSLGTLEARLSLPVLLQALAILSALAFILAGFVVLRPRAQGALWLLLALEAAVAINVFVHVASAVAFFHGYGPGLATAVLVNAPFAVYVLGRARREAWVSQRAWRLLAAGGLFLHGPVLVGALWLATQ